MESFEHIETRVERERSAERHRHLGARHIPVDPVLVDRRAARWMTALGIPVVRRDQTEKMSKSLAAGIRPHHFERDLRAIVINQVADVRTGRPRGDERGIGSYAHVEDIPKLLERIERHPRLLRWRYSLVCSGNHLRVQGGDKTSHWNAGVVLSGAA